MAFTGYLRRGAKFDWSNIATIPPYLQSYNNLVDTFVVIMQEKRVTLWFSDLVPSCPICCKMKCIHQAGNKIETSLTMIWDIFVERIGGTFDGLRSWTFSLQLYSSIPQIQTPEIQSELEEEL